MRHVFVETNWIIDYAAPAHHKLPAATTLLERADAGEFLIHIPSVCLTEARSTIPRKFQPKNEADAIRQFLSWAKKSGRVSIEQDRATRQVVDMFESKVKLELQNLDNTLDKLCEHPGIRVFPLNSAMLRQATALSKTDLYLQPFDQAILAAILVRARKLRTSGEGDLVFCERDSDLQPWNKDGSMKPTLTNLYDDVEIWVYGDYEMTHPVERPEGWGST